MPYTENQYRQRITLGQSGNSLMTLIAICLIIFVSFAFMKAVWYFRFPKETALILFNKNLLGWVVMPADTSALLSKPWTVFTHMFVHDNIWKVFTNMIWLWSFGYIMQDLTGNRKIVPIFLYGSIGSAIAFVLAYNFMPSLQAQLPYAVATGASAGVMAVAIATTIVSPGYRLFPMIGDGIPLWVLTLIYVVSDLATVSISDTGTLITHLAGAFSGFMFLFLLRRGYDGSNWMNNLADWVNNLFNPNKPKKGVHIKEELFYRSKTAPFKRTPHVTQERVDEILDKISQKGYHFLTEEEKDLLKRANEEL